MNGYERVIGIDVCTERLDIADSGKAIPMAIEYAIDEIKSKILKKIKDPKKTLVVCEASGGLEYALVDALHDAKIDVFVANPARVGGHPEESCHSSLLRQTDYQRETKEACTRCLHAQTADDSQRYGSA
jgi:hypothetical protein